ncbi:MAG TPA: hypothetical protein VGQ42_15575 [Candidatus Dormibacteraeota bacterium]|jgi:hypothetical protein|nr:hypothetical protein [Candidatus Dormibacteraeota bacterium]
MTVTTAMPFARRAWTCYEPVHALVYFAPEKKDAYDAAGLRGGWMGYFASRSAAMGAVEPAVVAATFHNFQPAMVARAIPDAWTFSTPARVLQARHDAVDRALRRLWGDAVDAGSTAEAADLALLVARVANVAGRPIFAAHAALPVPPADAPHMRLWHACTLLREHRFDGHVATLTRHGLDGCETLVTAVLAGGGAPDAEGLRSVRGWTAEEWAAAERRLRDRGLVGDGGLTPRGAALRAEVEAETDELAAAPWQVLSAGEQERLLAVLRRLVDLLDAPDGVPYPNPVGVPRPLTG